MGLSQGDNQMSSSLKNGYGVSQMEHNKLSQDLPRRFRNRIAVLGLFVLVIWFVEMVDWILGGSLDQFGILPRQVIGLRGIILAPLLHGSFSHVAANTIPFIILGWFVLLKGIRNFAIITSIIVIVSGLGTWLVAPAASVHIGASGLIFGFLGYLIFRGYFERSLQAIGWSILVLLIYGGMLGGMLPTALPVSWQMHLFGFIGGGLAAYLLSKNENNSLSVTDAPH
jgi:membrane associated rhomboid family serine protease